jgi:hypothetical protein
VEGLQSLGRRPHRYQWNRPCRGKVYIPSHSDMTGIHIHKGMFIQKKDAKLLNMSVLSQVQVEPEPPKREPLHLAKEMSRLSST